MVRKHKDLGKSTANLIGRSDDRSLVSSHELDDGSLEKIGVNLGLGKTGHVGAKKVSIMDIMASTSIIALSEPCLLRYEAQSNKGLDLMVSPISSVDLSPFEIWRCFFIFEF